MANAPTLNTGGGGYQEPDDTWGSGHASILGPMMGMSIFSGILDYQGQIKADQMQANAEMANAEFFLEQAKLAELETEREYAIYSRESDAVIGSQTSSMARSGVAFSGSAIQAVIQGRAVQSAEKAAILQAGRSKAKLARMRAEQASNTARNLRGRRGEVGLAAGIGTVTNIVKSLTSFL